MLEIKGAFRVTKTAFVSTHYAVLLLNDALLFVKTGSELSGADTNSLGESFIKRCSNMSKEEILALNNKNIAVHFVEIISLKLKKSFWGLNGVRTGTLTIRGNKISKFDLSPMQNYNDIEYLLQAVLPNKFESSLSSLSGPSFQTEQRKNVQASDIKTADTQKGKDLSPLDKRLRSGASWLFVIAAISLINTVFIIMGSDMMYVIGLAFTQYFAAYARLHEGNVRIFAIVFSVILAAIFTVCGVFARKGKSWAFIVAILIYLVDTALLILIKDWLSIAFHIFALCFMLYGTVASFKMKKEREIVISA